MKVSPRGDINSPVWFIQSDTTQKDFASGKILSEGMGFVFDKMLQDANISSPYIVPFWDDSLTSVDIDVARNQLTTLLDIHRPPFIVTLGPLASGTLIPETKPKKQSKKNPSRNDNAELDKWSGSLLSSPYLGHLHYSIPCVAPMFVVQNWWYRDIVVSVDFGRLKSELDYWRVNRTLRPLPIRTLVTEPNYEELMAYLYLCRQAQFLSVDIETIRPPKGNKVSQFAGHCGYPYTISLAPSPDSGISFSFWDYPSQQAVKIWRELDWLLRNIPQIGQNYFGFDIFFLEAMGFRICKERCQDTLIRHHILWPELEHSLQFQTKQYTRQPYYKDEGKNWHPKAKKQLMRYNALDTTVTYEVYLEQEKEFNERPHLR